MFVKNTLLLASSILFAFPSPSQEPDPLDAHLHPYSKIGQEMPPVPIDESRREPIVAREAARYALQHFERRGVTNLAICETHWIAAPVTGYLIDALGTLTLEDGVFTSFRIGVRDGLEEEVGQRKAGDEFVFIARGLDSAGRVVWFPPPGPDHKLEDGEPYDLLLPFEFLLDRERFETLATRYPIEKRANEDARLARPIRQYQRESQTTVETK